MAVYGIYFDTAKAELKAESTPALQEVAKMLGSEILGLEAAGRGPHRLRGRDRRQHEAVAGRLVPAGPVVLYHDLQDRPARLKGDGVGPLAPVATECGRGGPGRGTAGRACPAVARDFSSSASRAGRAGNGACGSVWYQKATEAMSSCSGR